MDNIPRGTQFNALINGVPVHGLTWKDDGGVYLFNNTIGSSHNIEITGNRYMYYAMANRDNRYYKATDIKFLTDEI